VRRFIKIVKQNTLATKWQFAWFFMAMCLAVAHAYSKWLAKPGAVGYDTHLIINRFVNFISRKWPKKIISLSKKKNKNGVKTAVKFINNFEQTAADIAISNQYDYVVAAILFQPEIRG
jgi:UDP-2,3-diacylglucosamine pyrophosphatase LpxH